MAFLHVSGTGRNRLLRDTLKGCIQCIVRGEFRIDVACEQFHAASRAILTCNSGQIPFFIGNRNLNADEQGE